MARKKTTSKKKENKQSLKNEIVSILLIAIGIFVIIALQTEKAGVVGKIIKNILMGCLSNMALVLPYGLVVIGIIMLLGKLKGIEKKSIILISAIYFAFVIIYSIRHLDFMPEHIFSIYNIKLVYRQGIEGNSGGLLGSTLAVILTKLVDVNGTYIVTIATIIIALILLTNISIKSILNHMIEIVASFFLELIKDVKKAMKARKDKRIALKKSKHLIKMESKKAKNTSRKNLKKSNDLKEINEQITILDFENQSEQQTEHENAEGIKESKASEFDQLITKTQNPFKKPIEKVSENAIETEAQQLDINIQTNEPQVKPYVYPSITLLNKNTFNAQTSKSEKKNLLTKATLLEETLNNFGVKASVTQVSRGPTVTRYEIQPSPGVKVSKIVNLADDIALNLEASSIRIEAPIPGKAAVGIEIQNEVVTPVHMREVVESETFIENASKLSFAIGKDISGKTVVADLAKMPHLLIAGATGSGKSVCINTIINSILFKASPDEVKLLLIDPKVVELNNYNGLPHLLIPVVTDPQKAAAALGWAVQEMTSRYKKFAEQSVRDLSGYNQKSINSEFDKLPEVVIIIDELADLMMVAPNQIEEAICRLAQMARAAGMHLIVATQRPSVDVITGVIKANIPSRIAFSVSSQIDSRTILDMGGAEKLLGKGDMLFYPSGFPKPIRVQGAFISDEEVENVIQFIKEQMQEQQFSPDLIEELSTKSASPDAEPVDELLSDAIELILSMRQASVSMLQRKFRIGYNRAGRLIDAMEERGIIGSHEGSKPRQVLMSKEEFDSKFKEKEAIDNN